MFITVRKKHLLISAVAFIGVVSIILSSALAAQNNLPALEKEDGDYIKWVDFNLPFGAMDKALKMDINSFGEEIHLNWVDMLSYLAAKYYGNMKKYKASDLDKLASKLKEGKSIEELAKDFKLFNYYREAYGAVLGGLVGEYEIEVDDKDNLGQKVYVKKYGLKAFSPIAKNYWFSHYDDFGNSRNYGFKRVHLGNDLITSVGTPVIAVESGVVEALGWNQYGGWRIGIRSFDSKRYYYYGHLRKDHPYVTGLEVGQMVRAGDVIGYVGRSGYSIKENVNGIITPHLHFGLQLIFDESQKEALAEIWVDVYNIVKLLQKNKSLAVKVPETKDYKRVYDIKDPVTSQYTGEIPKAPTHKDKSDSGGPDTSSDTYGTSSIPPAKNK